MGVSAPVVSRLPPDHVHSYGFLLAHLTRLVGCEKQRLCPPPPGNCGANPDTPRLAFRRRVGRPKPVSNPYRTDFMDLRIHDMDYGFTTWIYGSTDFMDFE
jgi:hypothetical protein